MARRCKCAADRLFGRLRVAAAAQRLRLRLKPRPSGAAGSEGPAIEPDRDHRQGFLLSRPSHPPPLLRPPAAAASSEETPEADDARCRILYLLRKRQIQGLRPEGP